MDEAKKTKKKPVKKAVKKATTTKPKKLEIKKEDTVEISPILKEEIPEVMATEKERLKFRFVDTSHEFKTTEVSFLVIIAMIIGICIGGLTMSLNIKEEKIINTISATKDVTFNKLVRTYNYMVEKYIDEVDSTKLIDGAIEGMLSTVNDPYTSYFDQQETTTFYKRLKGTFFGIGCEIVSDSTNVYVASILNNSPAQKGGIEAWDIITEINGTKTSGMTPAEVVALIENSETDEITLIINRKDDIKTIKITKANVIIESVHSKIYTQKDQKIGYIKIDLFAENTNTQFIKELKALENKNIDSLIIDVRNNSGGYLNVVVDIASIFFPKDQVIYQLETKETTIKKYSLTDELRKYKIVVLQNSGSASGSEILAGAIKEGYKGEVIGTNSYGKSSVQQTADLGDGTMIKYTVQKWLTTNGTNVGGMGLEPTIKVEQSELYNTTRSEADDTQLQKALSVLSE